MLGHLAILRIPSIAWATSSTKHQLVALDFEFNIFGKIDLIQQYLWDSDPL